MQGYRHPTVVHLPDLGTEATIRHIDDEVARAVRTRREVGDPA
jgi:hypothetical protein